MELAGPGWISKIFAACIFEWQRLQLTAFPFLRDFFGQPATCQRARRGEGQEGQAGRTDLASASDEAADGSIP